MYNNMLFELLQVLKTMEEDFDIKSYTKGIIEIDNLIFDEETSTVSINNAI